MNNSVPNEIAGQLSQACNVIKRHLTPTLKAIHLFGSALDGGLRPYSDIDLLVIVDVRPEEVSRQALFIDLLKISAPPGESDDYRALEVTVLMLKEVVPWRYPAIREMQFGEWLRQDIAAGNFESRTMDPDLAMLLTKVRQHSAALIGPKAEDLFDPVPKGDFFRVLAYTLQHWNSPLDWQGDERNIVLTLARIWYSAVTEQIAPKDVAANWLIQRLPVEYQPILAEAKQAYLGYGQDNLDSHPDQVTAFILFVKSKITELLKTKQQSILGATINDD